MKKLAALHLEICACPGAVGYAGYASIHLTAVTNEIN